MVEWVGIMHQHWVIYDHEVAASQNFNTTETHQPEASDKVRIDFSIPLQRTLLDLSRVSNLCLHFLTLLSSTFLVPSLPQSVVAFFIRFFGNGVTESVEHTLRGTVPLTFPLRF